MRVFAFPFRENVAGNRRTDERRLKAMFALRWEQGRPQPLSWECFRKLQKNYFKMNNASFRVLSPPIHPQNEFTHT